MKKGWLLIVSLLSLTTSLRGQVSVFEFEDPSPTNNERIATVGPNATGSGTGVMAVATGYLSPQGCRPGCTFPSGTNCLGASQQEINMVVPNVGGIFDLGSMRASIAYRRSTTNTEGQGWFWSRGTNPTDPEFFRFGLNNNKLTYFYRVDNGAGSSFTIGPTECWGCPALSSANIPADDAWHVYTFEYIQTTGVANIYIDGVYQYTEATAYPGRALFWTGAPAEMRIGQKMDGNGRYYAMLDNARIEDIILPVTLVAYEGRQEKDKVLLQWQTTSEVNNREYRLFKSVNGKSYSQIGTVLVNGNSNKVLDYAFYDENPYAGLAYYSLVQIDLDGTQHGLGLATVTYEPSEDGILELYPNPVTVDQTLLLKYNVFNSAIAHIRIVDIGGRILHDQEMESSAGLHEIELPTSNLKNGVYFVQLSVNGRTWNERFVKL